MIIGGLNDHIHQQGGLNTFGNEVTKKKTDIKYYKVVSTNPKIFLIDCVENNFMVGYYVWDYMTNTWVKHDAHKHWQGHNYHTMMESRKYVLNEDYFEMSAEEVFEIIL